MHSPPRESPAIMLWKLVENVKYEDIYEVSLQRPGGEGGGGERSGGDPAAGSADPGGFSWPSFGGPPGSPCAQPGALRGSLWGAPIWHPRVWKGDFLFKEKGISAWKDGNGGDTHGGNGNQGLEGKSRARFGRRFRWVGRRRMPALSFERPRGGLVGER